MKQRIDTALAGGQRLVASALWTQTDRDFVNSLCTVTSNKSAQIYDAALRCDFGPGRMIETPVGRSSNCIPLGTSNSLTDAWNFDINLPIGMLHGLSVFSSSK